MRTLSQRLYTVQALIPKGARVADIGTDHGHLPISLIKSGSCKRIIACDINEKPLANAKANIEKTKTEGIELRLGNGLSPVLPCEVDCIVIAGMGGEVISSILDAADWIKSGNYTLILQPMTSADLLRKYLCENGFSIKREVALCDEQKLYTVIKAVFTGKCEKQSEAYYRIGELKPCEPWSKEYILKQISIVQKCIDSLNNSDNQNKVLYFEELLAEMEKRL